MLWTLILSIRSNWKVISTAATGHSWMHTLHTCNVSFQPDGGWSWEHESISAWCVCGGRAGERTEGWRGWLAFYIARCFPSASTLSNVSVPTYETQTSLLWTWNYPYHESEWRREARLKSPIVCQPTIVSLVNANRLQLLGSFLISKRCYQIDSGDLRKTFSQSGQQNVWSSAE